MKLQLGSYKVFITMHFVTICTHITEHNYTKELKNMEELYPENKKILPVSSISVQVQERYPTRTAIDMRNEQTINDDAKTPDGITNVLIKHQCTNGV